MKYLITIFFSFILLSFSKDYTGSTYYFASAAHGGSDANGCTMGSPCLSLTKASGLSLNPGDNVFFNRGDTFPGALTTVGNGSSGSPITYGAYGTGAEPLLTGFQRMVGYTSLGGNIYSVACASCRPVLNTVTYGGKLQPMGRTPDTGYNTITATGTGYIVDVNLTGTPSYAGAELYLRVNDFTGTRQTITSQHIDTLFFTAAGGQATAGYGYIIQNAVSTLNTAGDWYFDSTAKVLKVYLPDTTVPVYASTVDTGVYANVKSYDVFDHLAMQGYNTGAYELADNTGLKIQYGNISLCNMGIVGTLETSCSYTGDTIKHCNDEAIGISGTSITNKGDSNDISHIGMNPGMGLKTSGYFGVSWRCITSNFNYNHIHAAGYDGVLISGNTDTVDYNHIDSVCFNLDDGGCMYWAESFGNTWSGRECKGNVVDSAIGAPAGTNQTIRRGYGFYFDDNNTGITVTNCTSYGNSQAGYYVHNSQGITIKNCNGYNNGSSQIFLYHDNGSFLPIRSITIMYDTLVPLSGQNLYAFSSISADYDSVGSIDSNRYPTSAPLYSVGGVSKTASQWQTAVNGDTHSITIAITPIFYVNSSITTPMSLSLPPGSTYWIDLNGITYYSYTLGALQSKFMNYYQGVIPHGYIHRKIK